MTAAVSFATPEAVVAAIGRAASVELSAYMLEPRGAMTRALEAAADRGADVRVTLEPFAERGRADGLRRLAGIETADLRAHGVTVRLGVPGGDTVHLKAAVVDGTAYLDDRIGRRATRRSSRSRPRRTSLRSTTRSAAARSRRSGWPPKKIPPSRSKRRPFARERATASRCSRSRSARGRFPRRYVCARRPVRTFDCSSTGRSHSGPERSASGPCCTGSPPPASRFGRPVRRKSSASRANEAGVGSANATFDAVPTTDWGLALRGGPMLGVVDTTFRSTWDAARPFT